MTQNGNVPQSNRVRSTVFQACGTFFLTRGKPLAQISRQIPAEDRFREAAFPLAGFQTHQGAENQFREGHRLLLQS